MAKVIRNTDPILAPIVTAHNTGKASVGAGASFHLDASERTVSLSAATDLPSLLDLVNQAAAVSLFARADTLAHKIADAATLTASFPATDLASAIALINELKADHNTHCASTALHYNADAANTVATADATDLASAITLANAFQTKVNSHMASAPAAASFRLVRM